MSEIRFAGYRITRTIGSGALSTIYECVHEPLGRTVVLKALKTQIAPTSSFGEQLDREARILADLVHPNIGLLLDSGRSASGRPFIVLEHIDGPSIEHLLGLPGGHHGRGRTTKNTPLGTASALAIACGICSALEHIHARGIVHRDIKPSNVLVSRTGVVKVIDFGIAQRPRTLSLSDALGTEGITASGRMAPEQLKDAFGTPAYMSPEQILGDFVDGRSDLFSLGVVLYQMLSGTRPFDTADRDDGNRSAGQRIRRDTPLPLRERAPHCPRAVERIVMRLLEKSPNDRYPSAGMVRERLESALRSETREDQASLARSAIVDAGFGPKEKDSPARERDTRRPAARRAKSGRRPPNGLRRAFVGFVVIACVFAIAVVANEGKRGRMRDALEVRNRDEPVLELLPERAGGLRVVATPWAHVRVDGQFVETTPFARPIPLGAGKHWVTLSHPDARSAIEREVTIATGEISTLDVTLDLSSEDAGKDAR